MGLKTIEIFESDYRGFDSFAAHVIAPVFGPGSFEASNTPLDLLQEQNYAPQVTGNIKSCRYMGEISAGTQNPLEVYDITLRDGVNIARSRVGIRQLVLRMLQYYAHAFMIFHYENAAGKEWRFSYLCKEAAQRDATSAKRFTYLFSAAHHCRTASERFDMLAGKREKRRDQRRRSSGSLLRRGSDKRILRQTLQMV
ncbi:hypothetical protein [Synergistes jonesii]|uniref:hypothetical protein n=1 Tax=Synergistes jonesii TaxID=2754 RepID=UPI00248E28B8|nr:hypothetical protein [Synergistes jonesii]